MGPQIDPPPMMILLFIMFMYAYDRLIATNYMM